MCKKLLFLSLLVLFCSSFFSAVCFSQVSQNEAMQKILKLSLQLEVQLKACKEALSKSETAISDLRKQLIETSANDKQRYSELSNQLKVQKSESEKLETELIKLSKLQEQLSDSLKAAQTERDWWRGAAIGEAVVITLGLAGIIIWCAVPK